MAQGAVAWLTTLAPERSAGNGGDAPTVLPQGDGESSNIIEHHRASIDSIQENGMRVEGAYTFPGDIERVFHALTNPDALARAIPGCERFIQFGPANAHDETAYEARLRLGQQRLPYTITLRVKAARRPAYLKLDLRGYGPTGPVMGVGSLDLVEQESHTVVAYRFTINGAELPEVGEAPSQSATFIARATCAHLADEIYAEAEDQFAWQPDSANGASAKGAVREIVTPRGRIRARITPLNSLNSLNSLAERRLAQPPLAWTERMVWMSAGLAMGLSAIALTAAIVRRIGAHDTPMR